MILGHLRQFFSSPPLFFAVGLFLFYGHEGGLRLAVSALFLVFIISCQIARVVGVPSTSRIRKILVRPAVQQILVAVLSGTIAFITLALSGPIDIRSLLFAGVGIFGVVSNTLTARQIELGFPRVANVTLAAVLLTPQVWGLMASGTSMFYNGGITPYVSLPLLIASAWLAIFGRFGPYMVNAGMPFYLNVIHNLWYGFSNYIGDNPNVMIVMACCATASGALLLGRLAHGAGDLQNIPANEICYVEIPGLVYRAPRFVDADDFGWQPVSFRI
ncbi:MAG: hypothetical protein AB7G06_01295 [Bdellovibrionales bacterium]